MTENVYTSDSKVSTDQGQQLADILNNMSEKLEGIQRLEKKLDEVTINFHGELDILKSELANIAEARKNDGAEIGKIQTSLKAVSRDLATVKLRQHCE